MSRYEDRHGMTVPTRVRLLERDADQLERRTEHLEDGTTTLAGRLDVLSTRVGIYAALGGAVGGGLLALVGGLVLYALTGDHP